MLIPIMMAREKDSDTVINLFMFFSFHLKKITREPNIVDNPAMVETSKAPIISILSPVNYMNL